MAHRRARGRAPDLMATDPRLLQTGFAVLVCLDLLFRFVGDAAMPPWPEASALLLAATTLATFVLVPAGLPQARLFGALAVLDIGVIGLCRLSPEGSGAAILVVGPAILLGRYFGRAGAVVAGVSCAVLVAVPGLTYTGLSGVNLSRSVLPTIVGAASAFAVAVVVQRLRSGQELAEQQQARLSEALATLESERRFAEAVFDTVDVGLVLLDRNGAYQTMNRRHAEFMRMGYPDGHHGQAGQVGSVYEVDSASLLTREQTPTYLASIGQEFEDRRLWIGEDPLTRRAISVSARSVRDRDGAFAGAALAYKDVTGFMRALQVKDEFVASVSHELRTPLTSIHGYASILLEREDLPREVVHQLEVVVRNTGRLNRLVADLLQSAQVDDGPMHVVRTRCDVAAIVRQSVEAATPAAVACDIAVSLQTPEVLWAMVDAQRIAQVVDNLLSNGIKYTPAGGAVSVCLGVDHDRIDLAVSDTGIGIGAADRDRLFTRFFRARHAEEQSIQGVGLGLSITKAIVESHGGRIEVESDDGRGSVFRVRLPLETDRRVPA